MKKIIILMLLCLNITLAYSKTEKKAKVIDLIKTSKPYYSWAGGINLGYFFPIGFYKNSLEPAPLIGLKLRFNPKLFNHFLIDLEGSYAFSNLKNNSEAKYSVLPIGLNFNYHYPVGNNFYFNASLGGGYYFLKLQEASYGNFYGKASTGLFYQISENLNLGAQVAYNFYYDTGEKLQAISGSLGISYIFDTPLTQKDVQITELELDGVFAAMYAQYFNKQIGVIKIKNTTNQVLSNIKVSLKVNPYMDEKSVSKYYQKIKPGQFAVLPLYSYFNHKIKDLKVNTVTTGILEIEYEKQDKTRYKKRDVVKIELFNRNALVWDDIKKLGSFLHKDHPQIINLARKAITLQGVNSSNIPKTILKTLKIFTLLKSLSLKYVNDPSSYRNLSKGKVDYIQYPLETLSRKTGDCDDLTVLTSSLLESVGLETALVSLPGHIFLMVLVPDSPQNEMLVTYRNKKWLALETTLILEGFLKAWQGGYHKHNKANTNDREVILINDAIVAYTPNNTNLHKKLSSNFSSNLNIDINNEMSAVSKLLNTELNIKQIVRLSVQKLNKLAIKYAKIGMYNKGETLFKQAIKKNNRYKSPYYNLITLYRLTKKFHLAIKVFENYNTLFKEDNKALFYISKVYFDLKNFKKASEYYKRATKSNKKLKNKYYQAALKQKAPKAYQESIIWEE